MEGGKEGSDEVAGCNWKIEETPSPALVAGFLCVLVALTKN